MGKNMNARDPGSAWFHKPGVCGSTPQRATIKDIFLIIVLICWVWLFLIKIAVSSWERYKSVASERDKLHSCSCCLLF